MKKDFIPEAAFWNFLESRKSKGEETPPLLDGVVISGGEPTMQPDLLAFMRRVKEAGFLVKLDTNGNRPDIVRQILDENLVDYIAMDLKTDLEHYQSVGGFLTKPESIKSSIELLRSGNVDYEFRSTLVRELHDSAILQNMAEQIAGAKRWFLQTFRPEHTLSPAFANFHPFTTAEFVQVQTQHAHLVTNIFIR